MSVNITRIPRHLTTFDGVTFAGFNREAQFVQEPYRVKNRKCALCLSEIIIKSSIYAKTSNHFCFIINLRAWATN